MAETFDLEPVEGVYLRVDRSDARRPMCDELGDHGIVEHGDLAALDDAVVDSHCKPLPFKGGGRGGAMPRIAREAISGRGEPHPNPSPEGEGLMAGGVYLTSRPVLGRNPRYGSSA